MTRLLTDAEARVALEVMRKCEADKSIDVRCSLMFVDTANHEIKDVDYRHNYQQYMVSVKLDGWRDDDDEYYNDVDQFAAAYGLGE